MAIPTIVHYRMLYDGRISGGKKKTIIVVIMENVVMSNAAIQLPWGWVGLQLPLVECQQHPLP